MCDPPIVLHVLFVTWEFYKLKILKLESFSFKGVTPDFRPEFENLGLFNR